MSGQTHPASRGEIAAGLAEVGPVVLRQQKRLLRRWERMTLDAAVDDSIAEFGEAFNTGEPQHHMNAFLQKKQAAARNR